MNFREASLRGAWIIEPECLSDERGFFARSWCVKEFAQKGLNTRLVQCNLSFNDRRGTLRGMHYQVAPRSEIKIVRCTKGAIYDVIIDLRHGSPTFGQWEGFELNAQAHRMLYIPEGFAHGFQTLMDESEVFYQMSEFYYPEYARGVRWDDPFFKINWPVREKIISQKDQKYPDFTR